MATAKTAELTITYTRDELAGSREQVMLGLVGVGTHPRARGYGFGHAAVQTAIDRAVTEGKVLIFQTGDALGLYERLGCVAVSPQMFVNSAGQSGWSPTKGMWHPFAVYHHVVMFLRVVVFLPPPSADVDGALLRLLTQC
jgi:GNAT superfamily N-acetyltransferase